jgi:hypothetical protein
MSADIFAEFFVLHVPIYKYTLHLGDLIGRIFPYWPGVRKLLKQPKYFGCFLHGKIFVFIVA